VFAQRQGVAPLRTKIGDRVTAMLILLHVD
jgi:hypothetical protein